MPTIHPGIFDHLVLLVLILFLPLDGLRRFRALRTAVSHNRPGARLRAYRHVMIEEWILCAVIVIGWSVQGRHLQTLGLVPSSGAWVLVGYGLTVLAVLLLLAQSRSIARSESSRQELRKALAPLAALMPQSRTERRFFGFVSVTAGVCEELIFRGFLFAYLAAWVPGQRTWLVVLLAGLLFGLAHLYQGRLGVVKSGGVGVLLGALYWLTGSLWAPMLLHAVIDLNSGWIGWRVMQDEIDEAEPGPAVAPAR